ncbi:MAG TPA: MarR family transcriptional regulator [Syntrophales bacterium]|nr:MarR family transcriptional regulator [Syntrophales bacterium]
MKKAKQNNREILTLISDLCQVIRCCRQDDVFCEDVTFSQFLILNQVAKKGTLKMLELHQILAVDKSTTTRLVNPLVRQGLIKRERSDHDSRAANLILTAAGREVHKKVWLCLENFVDAIGEGIPNAKRKDVYEAVKLFINAVKNASAACSCNEKGAEH